jgi:hypothetical protein
MSDKKIDPNLILVIGVLIVVFVAGRKILQTLGIVETAEDKEEKRQLNEIKNYDFWNFETYLENAPDGFQIYNAAYTDTLVERLWDATGWFNDSESEIYGVFRSLPTKTSMAFLAKRFYTVKNQDLYSYLDDYLNDSEMLVLNSIINPKPEYYA